MSATRRSIAVAFVVSLTLAAALGIAVYNLDKAYIASRFDLVTYVPDRLMAGGEASILVMALDNDGVPIPHKAIDLKLRSGEFTETVWSGYTDSEGFALPVFTTPTQSGKADIIVVSGSEELVTATVIDDTIRLIITTDKPVYQPGQTIHMRVLSFAGANPLPDSASLVLEVIDPNGDKIFKKQLTPDEFGISSYDLGLSDQLVQGTYTIKAKSGEREVTKAVIVKDYVLPKFRVTLLGMNDWYLVTQRITGVVDAEYFFGEYVEGSVQMNASIYYGVWTSVFSTQGQLSYGQFTFSINPIRYAVGIPAAGGNGYLQLNVSVTDTGGHTETRSKVIAIAPSSVSLTVLTDSCVQGQESLFHVVVRTPDGRPMANSSITMTLKDENGVNIRSMTGIADSRGVVDFEFMYNGEPTALFGVSGSYSGLVSVDLGDGSGIKVIPDKSSYSVGEVGEFEVVYSGESLTSNVYYDVVSRGFIVDRGVFELSDNSGELRVQMVPEMEPFAQVRVYKIQKDMDVVRDAVTFSVGSGPAMSVSIQADNSTYRPGDNVSVSIQTKLAGQPVLTALGVSIVDEAVFELDSMFQGYEQLIFGLDEEFVVPQYQVLSYVYAGASSLPSESEKVVSELDEGRMDGTWEQNKAEAQALMDDAVQSYWYSMFLVAGIGVIGISALGVRRLNRAGDFARRRSRGLSNGLRIGLVAMAIVITAIILLGGLYVMTLGFGGSSGSQPMIPKTDDDFNWQNEQRFAQTGIGFNDLFSGKEQQNSPEAMGGDSSKPTVVRNYFPETWYWNPCLVTDENGVANITLDAPDSITTWKADVIASTTDGQIGTGNASIKVFQPFFIDPDIPVSVVRGDRFDLKVQVYNYLNDTQDVNVTIVEEPWFTLISNCTQTVRVVSHYVSYVTFTIEASRAGWHTLTFNASSGSAHDAIVKAIKVVPDGTKQETLYNGEVDNATVTKTLFLSPDRIDGGENAWVKLQGGVEAVLLEGVDAFIQFVTGCGEQSLSTLSIDILAYDTVRQLGTAPDRLFEYETMVNQGLQHELTFLVNATNGQGRGIVWFNEDQDAHPWLTSWALIAFQDAINAGFGLGDDIIKDMQNWLMSIQEDDGSWVFPDWGIYEFNNPILKSKKIASTAYIARALLYSGIPGSDEHIQKAVDYVEANIDSVMDDPYTLSLAILVLQQGGTSTSLRSELASTLYELKRTENATYYWSSNTNMISDNGGNDAAMDMWGGYSSTRVIETTGYATMALNGEGSYKDVVDGAVKYLLNHRQSLGGWYSTQDTIVAFQTLKTVAGGSNIQNVVAKVSVNGSEVFSVEMGEFNMDVTYYVDIRPYLTNTTSVSVQCTGSGTLLYSIYLAQYVPWPEEPASSPYLTLTVTYDTTHIALTDSVTAHVYLLYNGLAPMLKMILVDLRSPMGLSFVLSDFNQLRSDGVIASFDSNERQVLVYLVDIVAGTPVEFNYTLVPEMPIKSTVQDISAWDMYDPNNLRTETLPVQFEVT
jgi:hypothetical protein